MNAIAWPEPDDLSFIEEAYFQVLGRAPDPGGLVSCRERLRSGLTRDDLLADLAASPEARRRQAGPAAATTVGREPVAALNAGRAGRALLDTLMQLGDEAFLETAYRVLLGREADGAGRRAYLARLEAGVPRALVLQELQSSDEGRRHGATLEGLQQAVERARRWPVRAAGWLLRRVRGQPPRRASGRQPAPTVAPDAGPCPAPAGPADEPHQTRPAWRAPDGPAAHWVALPTRFAQPSDAQSTAPADTPADAAPAGVSVILSTGTDPSLARQTLDNLHDRGGRAAPLEILLLAGSDTPLPDGLRDHARELFGPTAVLTLDGTLHGDNPSAQHNLAARMARQSLLLFVAPGCALPPEGALALALEQAADRSVACAGWHRHGAPACGPAATSVGADSGAWPLVASRAAFLALGGFDEVGFPSRGAVADYCRRAARHGLQHVVVTGTKFDPPQLMPDVPRVCTGPIAAPGLSDGP
jgi:hypothetical protein